MSDVGTNPMGEPITSACPRSSVDLETADRALYQMKRSGGAVTAPVRFNGGLGGVRDIVFRSPTLPFPGRRTEEYGLSDRESTDASNRAVDSGVVLVRTHHRLQHFWRRLC